MSRASAPVGSDTKIAESDRNRPEWAAPAPLDDVPEAVVAEAEAQRAFVKDLLAAGAKPDDVGAMVLDAVKNDTFWIFTDMGMVAMLADRFDSILNSRNPLPIGLI